ncbi:MAG: DUF2156 domain-containing protein [Bacteroidales bacterium]|nr:DUF2156 domain-containing protein [Bacteroidales bacterium]
METTLMTLDRTATVEVPAASLIFYKPTLADAGRLRDFFSRFPSRSCDYTVGGILLWVDYFNYRIAIYRDTLFIRGEDENGVFFHEPFGALDEKEAVYLLKEYCDANDLVMNIITPGECEADQAEAMEMLHENYLPGWREYIYDIDQFVGFAGKKMQKKRNHLNYFMNHFSDYEMEVISGKHAEELIAFNDKFNLYHKEGNSFDYESGAISNAIREYDKYPFFGILIRYKGQIIGYTFGEVSGDTFIIHAEKGDIDYCGVYQAVSSLLSREIKERFPVVKYLNREDDMDNDYLRQSKLSYHPTKFIAKWEISA